MADGILGLGSSGSTGLNSELILKLKDRESTAVLDPMQKNIDDKQAEIDATDEINSKISELLDIMKTFDLYTSGTNIFDEVTASTSGTGVSFDATDTSDLKPGTIGVHIDKLATKDVYQSDPISNPDATIDAGTLTIQVGSGTAVDYDTTGKSYNDLVKELKYNSGLDASLEQVGDNSYRLIIKSAESGVANAVHISGTAADDLGYATDEAGTVNTANHVITAQNMEATIDGINYNVSSNKVTLDNGLIITAIEPNSDSSITIAKDDGAVIEQINNLAAKYNELNDLVNSYTTSSDDGKTPPVIADSGIIRGVMGDIKNMFYNTYGLSDEENAFKYGISFNSNGEMEVDTEELSKALTDNYDDVKELFVGYAEKEGIGTAMKSYLDDLDNYQTGTMWVYQDRLDNQLTTLNDDYKTESDDIDAKYVAMANRFAQYTVIISQMEGAFSSMKMLIESNNNNN